MSKSVKQSKLFNFPLWWTHSFPSSPSHVDWSMCSCLCCYSEPCMLVSDVAEPCVTGVTAVIPHAYNKNIKNTRSFHSLWVSNFFFFFSLFLFSSFFASFPPSVSFLSLYYCTIKRCIYVYRHACIQYE